MGSTPAGGACFFNMDEEPLPLLRLLLARLERISADSYWAHRASGVRGSLMRMLEILENGGAVPGSELKRMTDTGFAMLEYAAKESAR
ncbi:MAG: hypothetical protein QY332_10970 [Anaerolineales bacterium]|nr:MAG: hypothetical protein QY332_10970 [Anaerolineales bacterium]